jgi:hypothetical protein
LSVLLKVNIFLSGKLTCSRRMSSGLIGCLLALVLAGWAGLSHASWGDTSHEYRECKEYCLKKNCTRPEDVELWARHQPLSESLIGGQN